MSPLDLILIALDAGATANVKDTTSAPIKDAYAGLKTLIQNKIADKPNAEIALIEYEYDPMAYEKPLREVLGEALVDQEAEIIEASQILLTLMQPQQAAFGKYNIQITGNVQGFAQGDSQNVTMDFGSYDPLAGEPQDIPLPPKPKTKPKPKS